jgi:hypothetical protein
MLLAAVIHYFAGGYSAMELLSYSAGGYLLFVTVIVLERYRPVLYGFHLRRKARVHAIHLK